MIDIRTLLPSARDRRALLVGGLLMASTWMVTRGYPAWSGWRRDSVTGAAEMTAELSRSRAMLASFPASLDSLEARVARLRTEDIALFTGRNPAAVQADFTQVLTNAASRASLSLEPIEVELRSAPGNRLARLHGRVRGAGDVVGLTKFLFALERSQGRPRLLTLAVIPADVSASKEQPERLDFRMDVEALAMIRTPGARAPSPAGKGAR